MWISSSTARPTQCRVSTFTWPADIYSKSLSLNDDCREFLLLLFTGHVFSTAGDERAHGCVLCGAAVVPRAHFVDGCPTLAIPTRDALAPVLAPLVSSHAFSRAWAWRTNLKNAPKSDLLAMRLAIVAKMALASVASAFFTEYDNNTKLLRPQPAPPLPAAVVLAPWSCSSSLA